jgi:hypothetical protein
MNNQEIRKSGSESETPRTDAIWLESGELPKTLTEKWVDALCRQLEMENQELRELLSNLCSALLHRMVGDEPTGQEVIALLNAYRAADEFLKPNSLQPKPLTASHA